MEWEATSGTAPRFGRY